MGLNASKVISQHEQRRCVFISHTKLQFDPADVPLLETKLKSLKKQLMSYQIVLIDESVGIRQDRFQDHAYMTAGIAESTRNGSRCARSRMQRLRNGENRCLSI